MLDELSSELAGKVKIVKLHVDDTPGTACKYGVRAIPTMILFQQGREVARISGALGAADIVRWVRTVVG